VKVTPSESLKWFQKAADQNCPVAMAYCGVSFQQQGAAHYDQAISLLRRSSELGYCGADFLLSCCYEGAMGVAKDENEAARWALRSAEAGYEYAQLNMGLYHAQGKGVEKDERKSFQWFFRAALKGQPDAIRFCGYYLTNADFLTPEKRARAFDEIEAVAKQGRPLAALELVQIRILQARNAQDNKTFDDEILRARRLLSIYARKNHPMAWYQYSGLFQIVRQRYPHQENVSQLVHYCRKRAGELGHEQAAEEARKIDQQLEQLKRTYLASIKADKAAYIQEENNGGFWAPSWADTPTTVPDWLKNPRLTDADVLIPES
jgi:TPR repeat protein